jgi:hypothetical protein
MATVAANVVKGPQHTRAIADDYDRSPLNVDGDIVSWMTKPLNMADILPTVVKDRLPLNVQKIRLDIGPSWQRVRTFWIALKMFS